jgi:2-oxoglutarate dehydrogenase E2 component (dihydrolipoamide succinyltransferase)
MDVKILVPSMGESIVEATVVHWLKGIGDPVTIGEPLIELETNKANLEIGAEQSGILISIERQEGQDVRVGETLGTIAVGADVTSQPAPARPSQEQGQKTDLDKTPSVSPVVGIASEEKVTPVAMRIVREHNLDPSQIPGSGAGGRLLKEDVEKFLAEGGQTSSGQSKVPSAQLTEELQDKTSLQPQAEQKPEIPQNPTGRPRTSTTQTSSPVKSPALPVSPDVREERVRLSRRRRTIAQKLVETQHTAAMLTTFNDVDMSAVMKIRQARKQLFKEKYRVGLGIVSFFVKAVILVLKDFPHLNAEIQGEEMVIKHYYDIGIAIGDEQGLVVPILRDADRMTFVEIEKSIQRFVQQTKEHKLSLEDIMGGTFTITNGGIFGSLLSTPILNGPEVGILGLHRIEDRPVVVNGEVVVRPMMYMALSYDHRIVDGKEAVQFLARIKESIQDPEILLLGL